MQKPEATVPSLDGRSPDRWPVVGHCSEREREKESRRRDFLARVLFAGQSITVVLAAMKGARERSGIPSYPAPFYTPERTFSLRVKYSRTHYRENFLPTGRFTGLRLRRSPTDTKPVADVVSLRIEYLVRRDAKNNETDGSARSVYLPGDKWRVQRELANFSCGCLFLGRVTEDIKRVGRSSGFELNFN